MTSKRSVSVRILGHEYRIRTDSDAREFTEVARLVDETMRRLRDRTGVIDSLDLAIMAALNLARDLMAERGSRRTQQASSERVRVLASEVERVLAMPGRSAR
jgi:cell division protein ZapA (FtsZ GTPase activity inhibitor)